MEGDIKLPSRHFIQTVSLTDSVYRLKNGWRKRVGVGKKKKKKKVRLKFIFLSYTFGKVIIQEEDKTDLMKGV